MFGDFEGIVKQCSCSDYTDIQFPFTSKNFGGFPNNKRRFISSDNRRIIPGQSDICRLIRLGGRYRALRASMASHGESKTILGKTRIKAMSSNA